MTGVSIIQFAESQVAILQGVEGVGPSGPAGADGVDGADGAPGTTDHGALTGLGDDDHPQYLTTGRADVLYQPLDSDLTAIAALTTTTFGRSLLALADAAAGRTALGLGSLATKSAVASADITDGTIVDADINASAAIALSKLSTTGSPAATNFLRGDGAWTVVPSPYLVSFVPWLGSYSNTNFDTRSGNTAALGNGYLNSTGAQNAEVTFNVALAAGTWTLKFLYAATTGGGIFTVSLDGTSLGTVDSYNGSTTYNNVGTISGFTVSAPGVFALNFKMATKNASSSNYFGFLQHVALIRTGA